MEKPTIAGHKALLLYLAVFFLFMSPPGFQGFVMIVGFFGVVYDYAVRLKLCKEKDKIGSNQY